MRWQRLLSDSTLRSLTSALHRTGSKGITHLSRVPACYQAHLVGSRSIIHLPVLGALGSKAIGLLALKKTAVVAIVSKVR